MTRGSDSKAAAENVFEGHEAEMPNPTVRGSRLMAASVVAVAMAPTRLSPAKMI
jgi:hypothetical protein